MASYAQGWNSIPDTLKYDTNAVVLKTGEVFVKTLVYNERTGALSFQKLNDSVQLTPNNVREFYIYDAETRKIRSFVSLEFKAANVNIPRPYFFEVLGKTGRFCLLSKKDPVSFAFKGHAYTGPYDLTAQATKVKISQREVLYILDAKDELVPYLELTTASPERKDRGKTSKVRSKILNENIIEISTYPFYDQLKQYAKQNGLSFKKKDDLIQIIVQYKEIVHSVDR